jgi:hypothetical protein
MAETIGEVLKRVLTKPIQLEFKFVDGLPSSHCADGFAQNKGGKDGEKKTASKSKGDV